MMKNKEKNFVSSVIYVHNAEAKIASFLHMIIDIMQTNFEYSEIICVNDASDDNSLKNIKQTSQVAQTTSISVVNMSYFHGLELAMNAGKDLSIGDFVFEFDTANQDYEPAVIMAIYKHSLKGFDIVSASPDKKEKFTSRLFYMVFDRFTDLSYDMSTESFRIVSRRALNRISSMNKTIPYRKAIYANCGLKTDNLKYSVINSANASSDKKEQAYKSGLAVDTLMLFTQIGYRFSIAMTIVMMVIALFMGSYSLCAYLIADPIEGWTTTVVFFSVAFFGVFGILTIVVKYLQLLIDMVFKQKHYNFESIEKLTK